MPDEDEVIEVTSSDEGSSSDDLLVEPNDQPLTVEQQERQLGRGRSSVNTIPESRSPSPRFEAGSPALDNLNPERDSEAGLFSMELWAGLPKFSCLQCAYDTLEAAKMYKHIDDDHYERFSVIPVEVVTEDDTETTEETTEDVTNA